ncbi:MAG: cation transporter [Alphaproteobacteria bacterium]|nr:cation transporter [Alphaproteobacteria bacterium]
MTRCIAIAALAVLTTATPGAAAPHEGHAEIAVERAHASEGDAMQGDHEGHADHGKGGHGHEHDHAETSSSADDAPRDVALIVRTDAIVAAIAGGGEPVVVDVLGVVCDFCAKAMNKTFGKRKEIAAVYVDLDLKTLNLVIEPGAELDDAMIEELVRKAGYKTSAIRRGAAALGEG